MIKFPLSIILLAIASLISSCQRKTEVQGKTEVQVQFADPPIAEISDTAWNLSLDSKRFQQDESILSSEQNAPWWGNEKLARAFMIEYFNDYHKSLYLEQKDLSSETKTAILYYVKNDVPVLENTPYIAYEDKGDSIMALAIYEPSTIMSGGGEFALGFPIVPVEIAKKDIFQYITVNPNGT